MRGKREKVHICAIEAREAKFELLLTAVEYFSQ
jgi:hypothetical protein